MKKNKSQVMKRVKAKKSTIMFACVDRRNGIFGVRLNKSDAEALNYDKTRITVEQVRVSIIPSKKRGKK